MFQFSGLASLSRWHVFNMPSCLIRKSADVTIVCISPQLIAAYHVLHRLSDPRHPPCALSCFKKIRTSFWTQRIASVYCSFVTRPLTSDQPKTWWLKIMWSIIDSRLTTINWFQYVKELCHVADLHLYMTKQILRLWTSRPCVNI